jgi:hypothetical protein
MWKEYLRVRFSIGGTPLTHLKTWARYGCYYLNEPPRGADIPVKKYMPL